MPKIIRWYIIIKFKLFGVAMGYSKKRLFNFNLSIFLIPLFLLVLFFLTAHDHVHASVNWTPITSENLNYGTVTMDVQTGSTSFNNTSKSVGFSNTVPESIGVDPTVKKIAIYNTFADSFGYNSKYYSTGSPFQVYNKAIGYTASRTSTFDTNIPLNSSSTADVRLNLTLSHIQHCIDAKQSSCKLGGSGSTTHTNIYYQPYYCRINSQDCVVNDGLTIKPEVNVSFLKPEIRVSSGSIGFGDVEVGQSKTINLTVYNDSPNYKFSFYFPTLSAPFSTSSTGTKDDIYPNSSKTYTITYTPTSEGTNSSSIYLSDSRANVSKISGYKSVAVTGNGQITPQPEPEPEPEQQNTQTPETNTKTDTPTNETSTKTPTQSVTQSYTSTSPKSTSNTKSSEPVKTVTIEKTQENQKVTVEVFKEQEVEGVKSIYLSGIGEPNTKYIIYVYSDPITFLVTTDENGYWEHILDQELDAGEHSVFAAKENSGEAVEEPIEIAQITIEETIPEVENPVEQINTTEDVVTNDKIYENPILVVLVISAVFLVIALIVLLFVRHKKEKKSQSSEGNKNSNTEKSL